MKSSTMTSPPLATQDWEAYTHREHQVWATLYGRRMATLRTTASRVFLDGVDELVDPPMKPRCPGNAGVAPLRTTHNSLPP